MVGIPSYLILSAGISYMHNRTIQISTKSLRKNSGLAYLLVAVSVAAKHDPDVGAIVVGRRHKLQVGVGGPGFEGPLQFLSKWKINDIVW